MSKIETNNNKEPKNKKPKVKKAKSKIVTQKTKSDKPRKRKTNNLKTKKSFFTELIENVEHGAKIVSEKTSVIASDTIGKVRKGANEAIDSSSKVVTELYTSATDYTDEFKDKIEMRKLQSKRIELESDLGKYFYKKYKIDKVVFSKFSRTREFNSLLKKIETLDQEVVELGKHLSK